MLVENVSMMAGKVVVLPPLRKASVKSRCADRPISKDGPPSTGESQLSCNRAEPLRYQPDLARPVDPPQPQPYLASTSAAPCSAQPGTPGTSPVCGRHELNGGRECSLATTVPRRSSLFGMSCSGPADTGDADPDLGPGSCPRASAMASATERHRAVLRRHEVTGPTISTDWLVHERALDVPEPPARRSGARSAVLRCTIGDRHRELPPERRRDDDPERPATSRRLGWRLELCHCRVQCDASARFLCARQMELICLSTQNRRVIGIRADIHLP